MLFKRIKKLEDQVDVHGYAHVETLYKLEALENYLGIDYFNGDNYKAHYRKRKVTKRPVGRPKKK